MKKSNLTLHLALFAILVFVSACTTAPLTEPHTARTLGKNGREFFFAVGSPGHLSIGHSLGWSDRLDVSALLEFQLIGTLVGLQAKYRLTPKNNISPLSTFAGVGLALGTQYGYLGLIKSFRAFPASKYELALGLRYNIFRWDVRDEDQDDAAEGLDDFVGGVIGEVLAELNQTYTYATFDVSNTYWFNRSTGLTLSTSLIAFLDPFQEQDFKAGLNFHFTY